MEVYQVAVLLGVDQRDDSDWTPTQADLDRYNTPLPSGADVTADVMAKIQGQRR